MHARDFALQRKKDTYVRAVHALPVTLTVTVCDRWTVDMGRTPDFVREPRNRRTCEHHSNFSDDFTTVMVTFLFVVFTA
jgi:hypothetical protein